MTRRLFALALAAAALAGCGAEALSAADSQAAARIESYCGRIGRSAAQMGKAPSPEGQRLLDRWSDPEKLAAFEERLGS
jgi:nitrous oxide reductase accessory protein NosL